MKAEMKSAINEYVKEGFPKTTITSLIKHKFNVTYKAAKAAVDEIVPTTTRNNTAEHLPKVVKVMRENYGKIPKQDLIKKMMEASGGTQSSMTHMYNYIKMAMEWAKQECEENK